MMFTRRTLLISHTGNKFRRAMVALTAFAMLAVLSGGDIRPAQAFTHTISGGIWDTGGAPLSGVDVSLYADNGNGIFDPFDIPFNSPVTTGASGLYTFTGVPDNTSGGPSNLYFVNVEGIDINNVFWKDTTHYRLAKVLVDGGEVAAQEPVPVTLSTGSATTRQVAFYYSATGYIGNLVWIDMNGNGLFDGGETGHPGATANLLPDTNCDGVPDGSAVVSSITGSSGAYELRPLPGSYVLQITGAPAGSTLTYAYGATSFPPAAAAYPPDAGTTPRCITVTSGSSSDVYDFGYIPNSSLHNISGTVWEDTNINGTLDGGELAIGAGFSLYLYRDNGDGTWDPPDPTTTEIYVGLAAGGPFIFNGSGAGLIPGRYWLYSDEAAITPYFRTAPANNYREINLTSTGDSTGNDFGYARPYVISGYVWNDYDQGGDIDVPPAETGINGVTVELLNNSAPVTTTVTAAGAYDGFFSFTINQPGCYQVRIPDGQGALANYTLSGGSPNPHPAACLTAASNGAYTTADFFYTGFGTISGNIWNDLNLNQANDGSPETGFQNITVRLHRDDGDCNWEGAAIDLVIDTTTTDAAGNFSFAGTVVAEPGRCYYLNPAETGLPSWATSTYVNTTENDPQFAPAVPTTLTITVGGTTTENFGYFSGTLDGATISGLVWIDANSDGTQQTGEAGIGSVTIQLYTDSNGNGNLDAAEQAAPTTTTTAADGTYSFTELMPGRYWLSINPYPGSGIPSDLSAITTYPAAAPPPGVSNPIVVTAQQTASGYNYGFNLAAGTRSIYGVVCNDLSAPGTGAPLMCTTGTIDPTTRDAVVELYVDLSPYGTGIGAEDFLYSTSPPTPADGTYSFGNLPSVHFWLDIDTSGIYGTPGTTTTFPVSLDLSTGNKRQEVGLAMSGYNITGRVCNDYTPDGCAAADPGFANVVLRLDQGGNEGVGSATTGADGSYIFYNLSATTAYRIVVEDRTAIPTSYAPVPPLPADPNPWLDVTTGGAPGDTTADFGFRDPADVGYNFTLLPATDAWSGEPGAAPHTFLEHVLTNVGPLPDTYTIYFDCAMPVTGSPCNPSAGYQTSWAARTFAVTGDATCAPASLVDRNAAGCTITLDQGQAVQITSTVTVPGSATVGNTDVITITVDPQSTGTANKSATDTTTVVAGTATLTGRVYRDLDNSGSYDAGEGASGIQVSYCSGTGCTTFGTPVTTTAEGVYTISSLASGTYRLQVNDAAITGAGYVLDTGTSTNPTADIVLTTGGTQTTDFRYVTAGLTGRVYRDLNGSGSYDAGEEAVGIQVSYCSGAGCMAFGSPVTTSSNGTYTIPNLAPGTYRLQVADGTITGAGFQLDPGVTNPTADIALTAGTVVTTNFRYFTTGLSGRVYRDLNNNDIFDTGEGVSGIQISRCSGAGCTTFGTPVTTGADGSYSISGLTPGTYRLQADDATITGGGYVLDAGFTNPTADITLASGQTQTQDFRYYTTGVTITAFIDSNANGQFDTGEAPFQGITFNLLNGSAPYTPTGQTATTSSGGVAQFLGLTAGLHRVQLDTSSLPSGYTLQTNAAGQTLCVNVAGSEQTLRDCSIPDGSIGTAFYPIRPDLAPVPTLTITANPTTATAGSVVTFTVTVSNAATATANLVIDDNSVTATVQQNTFTITSVSPGAASSPNTYIAPGASEVRGWWNLTTNQVTWNFGVSATQRTIAPGSSYTMTISTTVRSDAPLGVTTNTANATLENTTVTVPQATVNVTITGPTATPTITPTPGPTATATTIPTAVPSTGGTAGNGDVTTGGTGGFGTGGATSPLGGGGGAVAPNVTSPFGTGTEPEELAGTGFGPGLGQYSLLTRTVISMIPGADIAPEDGRLGFLVAAIVGLLPALALIALALGRSKARLGVARWRLVIIVMTGAILLSAVILAGTDWPAEPFLAVIALLTLVLMGMGLAMIWRDPNRQKALRRVSAALALVVVVSLAFNVVLLEYYAPESEITPFELPSEYWWVTEIDAQRFPATPPGVIKSVAIPALELDRPVVEAALNNRTWDVSTFDVEVAHLQGTSYPGLTGNTVLAGHVTIEGGGAGPFKDLSKLQAGDVIVVYGPQHQYVYSIESVQIVDAEEVEAAYTTDIPYLTLITCTDWNVAQQKYTKRLIVRARMMPERSATYY
ncbi:MAG: sortase [Anaerolineae bacterium]|nr:sortase [Anaerolineae bacterium]